MEEISITDISEETEYLCMFHMADKWDNKVQIIQEIIYRITAEGTTVEWEIINIQEEDSKVAMKECKEMHIVKGTVPMEFLELAFHNRQIWACTLLWHKKNVPF